MDQIMEKGSVCVNDIVKKLREQRMLMVQTLTQYMYIYDCLKYLALNENQHQTYTMLNPSSVTLPEVP